MPEGLKVLDMGIGMGGKYIARDDGVLRVGFDLDRIDLIKCLQEYKEYKDGVVGVVGDALLLDNIGLPFDEGVFDKIECYLPCQGLMVALTGTQLWEEFSRTLKPNGLVEVLVDIRIIARIRTFKIGGEWYELVDEHMLMRDAAGNCGFEARIEELSERDIFRLGTWTSQNLLRKTNDFSLVPIKVVEFFRIVARKT